MTRAPPSPPTPASGTARPELTWSRPGLPAWVKALEAHVKTSGNLYGLAEQPKAVGQAPLLYIADDTTRAFAPEIAQAMQLLLAGEGCEFTTLAQGTDGWALYDLGLWDLARAKATEMAGWIRASGAKTVVANCPALVYALREWYPTLGLALDAEILHHSEFLLKLGVRGRFAGRVTFHDPSYLSRYLHQVEAPRALLRRVAGLELAECYFQGEKANPSGPLAAFFNEEYAELIAARRADELALAAKIVVTAAPPPSTTWPRSPGPGGCRCWISPRCWPAEGGGGRADPGGSPGLTLACGGPARGW